ncbi:MAG: hypothetical protein U9N54_02785 [candidate division Zixibacteria bacterium]|nr:hypothetical protein [candidate division Zixibacteria bacterium]
MTKNNEPQKEKSQYYWLIYIALLLGGIILLAQAIDFTQINKWTAKLGIALLFSAFALLIANGKKTGYVATSIIWIVIITSYFI